MFVYILLYNTEILYIYIFIGKKFKLPKTTIQSILNQKIKICKESVGKPTIITLKSQKSHQRVPQTFIKEK